MRMSVVISLTFRLRLTLRGLLDHDVELAVWLGGLSQRCPESLIGMRLGWNHLNSAKEGEEVRRSAVGECEDGGV